MNGARALAGLLWLGLWGTSAWAAAPTAGDSGESIYRRGVLPSGAALEGSRQIGGLDLKGAEAACVNCHRRSGLGSTEGILTIPPITGQYLFHARGATTQEPVLHYVENVHGNRDPYTDATLARAIRAGLDSEGRPLGELMPRFALNDADMAALIAYLKKLGARRMPGVTDTLLHFATIVTPEADPLKRSGMLDVLAQFVKDKNAFPFRPSPQMRTSGKTMYAKSMYVANRHWQLDVWELTGPPESWRAQLDKDFARAPVMAVLSGAGGRHWAPVHDFCESQQVPCLFPNVEVPDVAEGDFYSLYFSKGVLLEAELIAGKIGDSFKDQPGRTVQQIYRAGDAGEAAARALAAALQHSGIEVQSHGLDGPPGRSLPAALRGAAKADALVLWLRPADLAALGEPSATPSAVYVSGLMGGLEQAPLAPSWRGRVRMAYLFDLPDRRVVRVDYPLGWFSFRHIPVVAEQTQADTYLACGILAETLNHMADVIEPDYLVERMQEILDHRILTGYYPRLTLATGQSLGSKGGYLVKFAEATGTRIVPDGEWTVP
jgi:mono/diheme cytochrome c family protein